MKLVFSIPLNTPAGLEGWRFSANLYAPDDLDPSEYLEPYLGTNDPDKVREILGVEKNGWSSSNPSTQNISKTNNVQMAKYQIFYEEGRLLGMVEAINQEEAKAKAVASKLRNDIHVREVRYRAQEEPVYE